MPYTPSLIQTILSVPELHRFLRPQPLADYHCRWGISPRPENGAGAGNRADGMDINAGSPRNQRRHIVSKRMTVMFSDM